MASRPSSIHRITPLSSTRDSTTSDPDAQPVASSMAQARPRGTEQRQDQGGQQAAPRSRFYFPESTSSLVSPNLPATETFDHRQMEVGASNPQFAQPDDAYAPVRPRTQSLHHGYPGHQHHHPHHLGYPHTAHYGQSLVASLPPSSHPSPQGIDHTSRTLHESGSGLRRRSSRASLAALNQALQTYRIHSPPPQHAAVPHHHGYPTTGSGPRTPPHQTRFRRELYPAATDHGTFEPPTPTTSQVPYPRAAGYLDAAPMIHPHVSHDPQLALASRSNSGGLRSAFGEALPSETMDALVDIHRVLYRGKEDLKSEGRILGWEEQNKEVRRVIERWFEGDCVYDHPLSRIGSRESLFAHFILLHLLSSGSIPSITPSAMLHHTKTIAAFLHSRLRRPAVTTDAEAAVPEKQGLLAAGDITSLPNSTRKGKSKEVLSPAVLAADVKSVPAIGGHENSAVPLTVNGDKGWWKLWDVSADCREIGGMECYDGYHLALIEQVVTLTLLPALAQPRTTSGLLSQTTSFSSLDLAEAPAPISAPQTSFVRRLAGALAREFDYLLKWDLPVNTVVEFNEVGKATRIRDVIDVQDVIDTFVPGAKRVGWLTRRLSGYVSSTLGSVIVGLLPKIQLAARPVTPGAAAAPEMSEKQKEARGFDFGIPLPPNSGRAHRPPSFLPSTIPDSNIDVSSISDLPLPLPRSELPSQDDLGLTETNLAVFNQHAPTINPIRPENLIPLAPHSRGTTNESAMQSLSSGPDMPLSASMMLSSGSGGQGAGARQNSLGLHSMSGHPSQPLSMRYSTTDSRAGFINASGTPIQPRMAPDCDDGPGTDF